jgi:Alw26I/Eco31I/Esp3I family type II restriction endonuclease
MAGSLDIAGHNLYKNDDDLGTQHALGVTRPPGRRYRPSCRRIRAVTVRDRESGAQTGPPYLPPLAFERRHGDGRRAWSEPFLRYAYAIAEHDAYRGMPCTTDENGKLDWIIPSNRSPGSKNWDGNARRREWWASKAHELGIATEGKWISGVAKRIHPWGWKPCQTCGRWMRIAYSYPTTRTIDRLNERLPVQEQLEYADFLDIYEVIDHVVQALGSEQATAAMVAVFPELQAPAGVETAELERLAEARLVTVESRKLSPGAMSNPPDRLDGFHTYNLCCRSKQDTGRSLDNLKTYGVDRRAFEHWSEGDWEAANLLMSLVGTGACPRCERVVQLTADHVGPISLGFRHTPYFEAVCGPCNSARGNRMRKGDVERLLSLEDDAIEVASWHAKWIWDLVKRRVDDDAGALRLSKLMNVNQHQFLRLLLRARSVAPDALLQFLSPQLAEERVEFVGLDPQTLRYEQIERRPRQATYAHSKAARLVRIAFEALDDYATKPKRNVQTIPHDLLAAEDEAVQAAIARAAADPSPWRAQIEGALDTLEPASVRENRLTELLGSGRYQPEHDYDYLRCAFADYMRRTGETLAERFTDDRAIKLWADPLER